MADDRELWERICRGDISAFEGFYRENAPRLQAFLGELLSTPQAAEDVAQETFLQLLKRRNGFRPDTSLRAYLFGIAKRRAAEWWRQQDPTGEANGEGTDRPKAETCSLVGDAFAKLDADQRSLLWLREVEGQSYADLAGILGIPVGTVRSRLAAARRELRQIWHDGQVENLPMEQYEFEPGQEIKIEIAGLGEAELTGELLDYMPVLPFAPHATLDPAQNELRLISPLLLRGREAIIDMDHSSTTGTGKDGAAWMYAPGVGRLIVSAENFQGAVRGQVSQSRIDFEIGGKQYQLLAGAPITRTHDVWVQFDPNFQSSENPGGGIGWAELKYLLAKQATPD